MVSNICRICGTTFNLMHVLQGGQELIEKLRVCANIEVNFEDSLPNYICLKCEQGVSFSYRLRKQSEAMEQKLRQQLRQSRPFQRHPQSINCVDLCNEVDDIEEELEEFRVENNSVPDNNSGDDDQLVLTDGATKKAGSIGQTSKKMSRNKRNILRRKLIEPKQLNSEDIRKPVYRHNLNNFNIPNAKSEDENSVELLSSEKDEVSLNPAPADIVIDLHCLQTCVSSDNNITPEDGFSKNVLMSNSENAMSMTEEDDIEIIEECKEPAENVKSCSLKLDDNVDDDDEVQIIEECFELCGEYANVGQENSLANVDQPYREVDYLEDIENITASPMSNVYSPENDGIIQIEQSEEDSYVETIEDLSFSGDDSQDNVDTECEGTVSFENGESMRASAEHLHFETMQDAVIDEVQVVSDDEYPAYNDSETDKSQEFEEAEESLPENMQTTILSLQNRGSLKISVVYKCDTCGQTLKTQGLYRQHIKEHGRERFSCMQCNKWFPTRYRLQQHERIHNSDPHLYVCNICANHYRHPQNLKRHMQSAHNAKDYNPFQCGVCKEIFSRSDVLRNHTITKHIEEGNFICELCSKSFESMLSLIDHGKSHLSNAAGVKNSINTSNSTSTSTDSSCSPQRKGATGSQRTYYCSFCGKISKHHFAHKNHLRTHTLERPYPCKFCKKKFRTLASKTIHERIHNDKRPYECNRCPRTFRQSHHLKEHQLIHDGIMAFVCSICHIAFTKKGNLKVHMRIHTGERPYECAESDCGQQFAKLAQLKRHAAQAHARDGGVLDGDDGDVGYDDQVVVVDGEEDEKGEVEVLDEVISDEGILGNGRPSLWQSKIIRINTLEEPYLNVDVGAEETAIEEMLTGSDSQYNSLYSMDNMNL